MSMKAAKALVGTEGPGGVDRKDTYGCLPTIAPLSRDPTQCT